MTSNLQPVRDPDIELESRIREAYAAYYNAIGSSDAHRLWQEFVSLVAQRSPAKVEQMERERHIR